MQVDFPKSRERNGHAVQFILQARAFLPQLFDYRLNKCLWHSVILAPESGPATRFARVSAVTWKRIPVFA